MYGLFLTDSYSKELRGFRVTYNHANSKQSGIRKSENFLYHTMEMYIKRYCMKLEVINSNTTLHTSKAKMQFQKLKRIIKRCVIIRGHNKYTLTYHRIKSTSKYNMNHVEHTSHRRHYVSTHG